MSGKKLINNPENVVDEALEGLTMIHPGLRLLDNHRVVVREQIDPAKVSIISGGGSGHEPFCAGYIGSGMLTGGVAGSVFASPPTASILEGIRAVSKNSTAGVLVLVINYTGDRIHFGLAVERARSEGIQVEMFVNGEDCALTSVDKSAGRRGLCGTMFIFKIAGAMAEAGQPLEKIVATTKEVSANMGTMGLALGPCSLPGQGPLFSVAEDALEIGLGVHGEAGVGSLPLCTAHEAVKKLLDHMTNPSSATKLELREGEQLAVILNNLGGTSKLEELVVARELVTQLEGRGYSVVRLYAGHMMTSLEMAGILISLLRVTEHPEWLQLLDAPTAAPAWPSVLRSSGGADRKTPKRVPTAGSGDSNVVKVKGVQLGAEGESMVKEILTEMMKTLIGLEGKLNELDSGSGDGDCGSTLAAGAKAILSALSSLSCSHPLALLSQLASLAENMGGSSGGIYSILLTSAGRAFQDQVAGQVEPQAWVRALRYGLEAVMRYGGAAPGDRTMIDALHPALLVLEQGAADLSSNPAALVSRAAKAATDGAAATKSMKAKAGRASYVAESKVVSEDPGAVAAAAWFSVISDHVGRK